MFPNMFLKNMAESFAGHQRQLPEFDLDPCSPWLEPYLSEVLKQSMPGPKSVELPYEAARAKKMKEDAERLQRVKAELYENLGSSVGDEGGNLVPSENRDPSQVSTECKE